MTVVVAAKELQPRIAIAAASLATKTIPVPASYPKIFFTRMDDVLGKVPLVTINSGQAITSNDVAAPSAALGAQSEYLPIPQGYVALTIPTSEQQGVAFNIQPNDYISVIATVAAAQKVASKTIFYNLHVIKVGLAGTGSNSAPSSLTVVVTECQAEIITWFLTYASLKYALESFHDYLKPDSPAPDQACPNVQAARGVTLQQIQAAYPTLF